jgi:hypothetical protein
MKTTFFRTPLPIALFLYSGISLSAVPITVTFNSGTTSFASNGSGTANYVVNVKGIVPSNVLLTFNSNPNSSNGLTANQVTTGPSLCSGVNTVCSSPTFSLKANQSCCLEYALTSSNAGNYTLQPSVSSTPVDTYRAKALSPSSITVSGVANTTPLTATPSTLALSVDCPSAGGSCAYANAALTGNSRQITITNTSLTDTTTPLTVTSASFPTGTSIVTDTCTGASLAPQGTCTITIKPGQEASSGAGNAACTTGIQPNPGTVTVNASSAPSEVSSNIDVLSYGCIYQEGYVYSVDDTTNNGQTGMCTTAPCTGSIGGKVASLTDQAPAYPSGIVWDSSSGCINSPYNNCYTTSADSGTNGTNVSGGNTYLIYQTLTTTHSELATSYAAGLCTSLIATYSDWYLPAICEMGYGANFSGINCGTQASPALQNMQANLVDNLNLLTGFYWSSTGYRPNPTEDAWGQLFASGGSSGQGNLDKGSNRLGVRCSRALTL